jgi:hypothetical protein
MLHPLETGPRAYARTGFTWSGRARVVKLTKQLEKICDRELHLPKGDCGTKDLGVVQSKTKRLFTRAVFKGGGDYFDP